MLGRARKVRYSTACAVIILVSAAFVRGTTLFVGASVNTLTGVLMLIIGIGYLSRPLAELTETELTVFALFGPLKKHYPIAELSVVDGRLRAGGKKIALAGWTANGDDLRAVL